MDKITPSLLLPGRPIRQGFTLLELLVVLTIMGIILGLTAPAFTSIAVGSGLNRSGQILSDQLALARQEAVTKNRDVQIWFVELEDAFHVKAYRGLQIVRVDEGRTGPEINLVGPLKRLPDGFIINATPEYSPLLNAGGISGNHGFSGYGDVAYRGLHIRANGSLDSAVGNDNFVTLQSAREARSSPKNFYTIQISSITAKVTIYRP